MPGRKPLPNDSRRTERITVWVTPAEKEEIIINADIVGKQAGPFLRERGLGTNYKAKPSLYKKDLIYHLARIGNNLNQLAHHANKTDEPPSEDALRQAIDVLMEKLKEV